MLIKLILENYVPLLSSGITKVELNVEHMVNLFIAQNGTGKTSILKEMNPLPPENGNFENGRKYVEIKIGQNLFILDSVTGQSDGHTFKLNGVNLNKGGTYTAQKELVWSYFKLDANRNKVLSGLKVFDLFSNMPINRRKEVMMWLYPNDTQYVMSVFNKLKTERNELKAAIKNQVGRHAEESRKLASIAECGVEELENRIRTIDNELRQSLMVRGSLEQYNASPELQKNIRIFTDMVDRMAVNTVSGFFDTEVELLDTIEMMEGLLQHHQEQAAVTQRVISEHAGLLEGMEEFLEDPLVFQHQAEQLEGELNKLKEEADKHSVLLNNYALFKDPNESFKGLEHVHESFCVALRRVVLASDQNLNGGQYKQFQVKFEQIANELREVSGQLTGINHQLKHYDNMEAVNCPECDHEFKVGVTAAEIAKLRTHQTALSGRIERLEQEKVILRGKLDNDEEWYETMMSLHQFCRQHGDVPCLVQLVKEYDIGKADTNILLNAIRAYMGLFDVKKRKKSLLEEQDLLNTRIGMLKSDNVLGTAVYIAGLEAQLQMENNKVAFYRRKLKLHRESLDTMRRYEEDLDKLQKLRGEILKGLEHEGLVDLRKRVDTRISILTEEKDNNLRAIIQGRSLNAVVNSISEDIDRLKRRILLVETWMDGMCPNKGYIGKLMTDFIKTYCGNMNAVIQSVWNTPLYVKPCNKGNGDLTYKFPVVVGDSKPVPDISDCSLGQTGIIDFAFRYVALSYHGYNYPLFMDEVGTAFDEIKRGRFFNFVKDITQKKDARQLFCVSHYLSAYGIFNNPNVVAMRYEGLSMPGEPNKHSTII
mgnify:CR=1 FL=1